MLNYGQRGGLALAGAGLALVLAGSVLWATRGSNAFSVGPQSETQTTARPGVGGEGRASTSAPAPELASLLALSPLAGGARPHPGPKNCFIAANNGQVDAAF